MIKLKPLLEIENHNKGFNPPLVWKDVGKFCVVYKDEDSLVKGTRLYDTFDKAKEIVDLINDPNVVVKQIGFPNG